jgi:hypothetical protein
MGPGAHPCGTGLRRARTPETASETPPEKIETIYDFGVNFRG